METRQKCRGAEEQYDAAVEKKSRKGKGILIDDQRFKVWDIEDDSEEELAPGEGNERPYPQDRLTDDEHPQMEENRPASQEMKVRRYGMRKRGRTPGRGVDSEQKRGRAQNKKTQEEGENSRQDQNKDKKAKRTVNHRIRRAGRAYQRNSNPAVRRIMQYLEEESLQEQSAEEMEEWGFLLHDPGHTRGRMSLFKQSLHIYWVMKGLLAKALEQVAKEMVELAQGNPDIRRELSFIRIAMAKQEEKLEAIQQTLKGDHQETEKGANQQPDMDTA